MRTRTHTQLIHNHNDKLIRLKEQTWCFASSVLERDSHCELQRAEARRLTGWSESELKPVLSSCTARLKHNAKKTISSLEGFCSGNTFQHFFTKQPETTLIFIYSYYFIFFLNPRPTLLRLNPWSPKMAPETWTQIGKKKKGNWNHLKSNNISHMKSFDRPFYGQSYFRADKYPQNWSSLFAEIGLHFCIFVFHISDQWASWPVQGRLCHASHQALSFKPSLNLSAEIL